MKRLILFVLLAGVVGCSAAATTDDLTQQQPRVTVYDGPVDLGIVEAITGPKAATTQPSVAAGLGQITVYDGGLVKGRREFAGFRGMSPFDNSPNDVVAHRKGREFEIESHHDLKVTKAGVDAEIEVEAESEDEGGRESLLDTIWNKIFTIVVCVGVIWIALYAIPYTRPLAVGLWGIVKGIIPGVGSTVPKPAETPSEEKPDDETA